MTLTGTDSHQAMIAVWKCRSEYQDENVIIFNEWWPNPDALQIGSPLQIHGNRTLLVNGIFGNGSDAFPYYAMEVQGGTCSRLRFIAAMGEDTCESLDPSFPSEKLQSKCKILNYISLVTSQEATGSVMSVRSNLCELYVDKAGAC